MPNARVVGNIGGTTTGATANSGSFPAPATPGSTSPALAANTQQGIPVGGSITVADILAIINAQNSLSASAKKDASWQPPAGSHPNQQAFDAAPAWVPGAQYFKTGTKPQNVP